MCIYLFIIKQNQMIIVRKSDITVTWPWWMDNLKKIQKDLFDRLNV